MPPSHMRMTPPARMDSRRRMSSPSFSSNETLAAMAAAAAVASEGAATATAAATAVQAATASGGEHLGLHLGAWPWPAVPLPPRRRRVTEGYRCGGGLRAIGAGVTEGCRWGG